MHDHSSEWSKSGAPIAHVLNNEISMFQASQPGYLNNATSAAPFSGKLVDLLLDTTNDVPTKYRKTTDDQPSDSSPAVFESSVIQLPKPRQQPKQTAKRPRIPPLLQGLHQPPPLPPASRLFPPITDGVDTFERDLRGKADAEVVVDEKHGKEDVNHSPSTAGKAAVSTGEQIENPAKRKRMLGRKRRKWSDEETRDLLLGVSRFGIGSWKKILHCEDFRFDGRTAVDLKDRFRVCCPDEASKSKKVARKGQESVESTDVVSEQPESSERVSRPIARAIGDEPPPERNTPIEITDSTEPGKPSKLAKFGIEAPFAPNTRRPRRAFSTQDDENLWKGYEKYGAVWHLMRDDEELGFSTRHPTDLRDRFRIRYPDIYARAGYKVKPNSKGAQIEKENYKTAQPSGDRIRASTETSSSDPKNNGHSRKSYQEAEMRNLDQDTALLNSSSKPTTLMPFLWGPTPTWLDDMSSIDDGQDGNDSPIILNRNILQWADSNSGPTSTPRVNVSLYGDNMGDTIYHNGILNDSGHIDPMATLNLPFIALPSQTPPSTNSRNRPNHPPTTTTALLNPSTSTHHHTPTDVATSSSSSLALPQSQSQTKPSSSTSTTNTLLRTPNLPTIVFPHVPVASARNAVHNLPTPADLLSGMDSDMVELHVHGSGFDGVFGIQGGHG